jgi:methylmalonyl-CoA/ethylmalonyl-CoA epimerase
MAAVLDHLAIGTPAPGDGWDLFSAVLGGTWAYGGDSPGYWWGQLEFAAGPKIELLTPTGGPDGAFLDRFLAARGPGPHHFSFLVTDIEGTLARIRAFGIEPVGVNLDSPHWREAFLHPRSAHGIVVQVAQQGGPAPSSLPRGLPEPGPPSRFELIEYRVGDLDGAARLFRDVLDGQLETLGPRTAELTWPGGKRIRLVHDDGLPLGGALHRIRFTRAKGAFSAQDGERAGLLAKRLGLTVELADQKSRALSRTGRGACPASDRPGLHAVAHVPEHPLIPAGDAEVPVHSLALSRLQARAELVGDRQHLPHHVAEVLAPVQVDPPLVARVR